MLIGRYINFFFFASWANILTDDHTPTEFEPCGISWWIYNNNQQREGPPYGTIVQSGWETVVYYNKSPYINKNIIGKDITKFQFPWFADPTELVLFSYIPMRP